MALVRFGDLEDSSSCAEAIGSTEPQLRSLRAHPYARREDPAALLLLHGDKRVGRFGFIPGLLKIGEREHLVHWGTGWEIDRTQRLGPAGAALLLRARHEVETLLGCGPSALALPIYRAAGFDVVSLYRMVLVVRSHGWLARHFKQEVLARALAAPIDALLGMTRTHLVQRVNARGQDLAVVARFTEDTGHPLPVEFVRHASELNWVLEYPWHAPDAYRPIALQGPLGHVLARLRRNQGETSGAILRVASRPGSLARVIEAAIVALVERGADRIELASSDRETLLAASRAGMKRHGSVEVVGALGRTARKDLAAVGLSFKSVPCQLGEGDVIFA